MRRKSSAQNLLTSFKNTPGIPSTPTASTPMNKEFDTQSLFSDTTTLNNPQGPAVPQGTSIEYLRDLVQKRIITLTYLRSIHEGRSHWFHTIAISRTDLERVFNNTEMKKRTYRFAILGMSLSGLLDISHPQDLLKGLINTLQEYEQSREDSDKPKIRPAKRLFRTKMGKRPGMLGEYGASYSDASEAYLVAPHIPFPLDYHQTLLSLLDVLSEVYNKISKLLGPSPFSHSAQNMMGPLGLLAPHPGVSYVFENGPYGNQAPGSFSSNPTLSSTSHLPTTDTDSLAGSLWSVANVSAGGHMSSPPTTWTASLGEMVLKIDGKFKKITTVLLKELDQFARNGIKDELASLDPLLRNINIPEEGGRTIYEFEGM
ncbi:hypothetical protein DFH08DRAFT_135167 [Mycena albidolilacea]|uniref:Uncharacterized protein n=1 Tax=Mycena albidolilacea TaxID=1033008 RepID=A0AAD7A4W4_9AGAR|nr:hypothetical protein DFH08DRAFT_135167 [Mycena albidolilacea]